MFIPGQIIAAVTFPGIIVHEAAHKFFCDISKVPVYEVSYFNFSKTPGYVVHGPLNDLKSSFLIAAGPLIINSALCMVLTAPASISLIFLGSGPGNNPPAVYFILMWLGLSIGMHAFPSPQDAANFKEHTKQSKANIFIKLFAWVFVIIITIAHALRVIWFDLFYALALSSVALRILL